MLRLNMRHQLPQIDFRIQHSQMISAHPRPAELHSNYRAPRSNMGTTMPTIEIDSYPSRHSYGYNTHIDEAREHGQKGLSDLQGTTSRRTQRAWQIIESGAQRGNDIASYYDGKLSQQINRQRRIEAQAIPDPEVHITPCQLVGEPDPGAYDVEIQTSPKADVQYQPGSVQTYVKDEGFLRRWVTEGKYDIYA